MSNDEASAATAPRLTSLDGLRGLASLVVVLWHVSLLFPQVIHLNPAAAVGSVTWWLAFTPLKLFSAGPEAVLVFFVLSGMVVVLPVLRRPDFEWISYYPRRVLRLYLPIFASIVFASILVLIHPQVVGEQINYWVGMSSVSTLTPAVFAQSLDIFAAGNTLNNPLWSLRWEFIFSLALPVFAAVALVTRRRWQWGIAIAVLTVWLGYYTHADALTFLPMFYAGAMLAVHAEALTEWARKTTLRPLLANAMWLLLLLGGLALLISNRMLHPFIAGRPFSMSVTMAGAFVGAALIVAVCFLWSPAARALSVSPVRWLGRVSFSLYLVHVPILIFFANILGPGQELRIAACTLPTALIVAELFARFVEGPAHRLSRSAGSAIAGRYRAALTARTAHLPARESSL